MSKKKNILVIGASSKGGLGEAIAQRLADGGAHVTIAGRRQDALHDIAANIGCEYVVCDVNDEEAIQAMLAKTGKLDALVNSAGTTSACSIAAIDKAIVEGEMQIHYVANVMLLKHALAYLKPGSAVVLFSSVTATLAGHGLAAYSCAKAACEQLVRLAAIEFGERGIRVNAVAPGFSETPMTAGIFANPQLSDLYLSDVPLGARGVSPNEVAAATAWLISDECFTTGETIQVSGGAQMGRLPTKKELKELRSN